MKGRSVHVGSFSVYCAVPPETPPKERTYAFIVEDSGGGPVRGVIPLADRPSPQSVRAQLRMAGFSEDEALHVTETFHVPDNADRLDDKLYEP
ncbi:MAG: hypothetical protein QOI60_157 [Actinomycetota bacterium]|nr:hypothetical protein [Actinomycetota bacterium]